MAIHPCEHKQFLNSMHCYRHTISILTIIQGTIKIRILSVCKFWEREKGRKNLKEITEILKMTKKTWTWEQTWAHNPCKIHIVLMALSLKPKWVSIKPIHLTFPIHSIRIEAENPQIIGEMIIYQENKLVLSSKHA